MAIKEHKKMYSGTLTRCTIHAQKEVKALAARLFKAYPEEHRKLGINRPMSKVAIDALLYWAALDGELNGKKITDSNNIFSAIRTISEEE